MEMQSQNSGAEVETVKKMDVATTFEKFTKTVAQELFDNREQNRNIRTEAVSSYRILMNNNKWVNRCRSQTPILIKDGKLVGGQHRMLAFIKSNLNSIEFPVVRDVLAEELPYQDSNIARTTRDRVNMFEKLPTLKWISNTTLIASTRVVMEYKIQKVEEYMTETQRAKEASNLAEARRNASDPENIAMVVKEIQPAAISMDLLLNKKSIIIRHAAAVAAFFVAKDLMDTDKWEYCVIKTGDFEGLSHKDPMYNFRDFVGQLHKGYSNQDRWEVFLKTLYCLRAHQLNDKILRIYGQRTVLDSSTW